MPSAPAGTVPPAAELARPESPRDLFVSFTWLALQGFGGVLAVAQRELVERKRWLSREEFVEVLALGQVLPGPNIVNLGLMLGDRFFGLKGALAAVAGMLAVPLVIVLLLTAAYAEFSRLAVVSGALRGMGAVAAGLIIATAIRLMATLGSNRLCPPLAAAPADDGQWTMPAKNYASTRFSALRQIKQTNVGALQLAFTFSTGTTEGFEAPPLVVDGTMYVISPWPNNVFALDLTKPGAPAKWTYEPKPAAAAKGVACCGPVNRGAFYSNGEESFLVPSFPVVVVDTTAAGDAFNGGFAAALARNVPVREAVRQAMAIAALCVTRRGAQPSMPTAVAVDEFLNHRTLLEIQ